MQAHLLQTMVPVLVCAYLPYENKSQTKRPLSSGAAQVSTGSHFLVLFTLGWNTAASGQGPFSIRTTSLEVLWWTQFGAISSPDLPFDKLCWQFLTMRAPQMAHRIQTAQSVKMSHICQVTIAILSHCFCITLPRTLRKQGD